MLSGGERRRLQLVIVLATKPNLLVLDEPTNDLDLDTLRALEAFLDEWPGALVVASHDRTFLDRTVDHVLAIDPDGSVRRVAGGVQGWLAERARPVTGAATKPSPAKSVDRAERRQARTTSQYTLGRQLREAEQAMAKLQRQVDRLNDQLVATVDHTVLASLGAELATAQAELSTIEENWLELAERQSG
jgi:ATP-binding cassette subfamily F protein uup